MTRAPRARDHRSLLLLLAAAVVAAATVPTAVGADDRDTVLALRAADLEAQGRCDDVVSLYEANAGAATDGRLALIAGRCEIRSQDYAGALPILADARDRAATPAARGAAELQLGVAQYHLGDLDAARASLDDARAEGVDDPLLDLYDGLLLLQANDARRAALSLERARRGDARAVEPVASYYAFLAWRSLDDEKRARAAYERVRETDPDGPWTAEAERVLAGDRRSVFTWEPWFGATAGLEYDSNVVLKGDGVGIVYAPNGNQISGKDDGVGYWALDGGLEVFRTENWSGGVLAGYTANAHFDLTQFDTQYPTASGWVDRRLGDDSTARLRYDYGYAWVDYDSYLSGHTVTGSFFHYWGEAGSTELYVGGYFYDFLYDQVPFTPNAPRCTDLDRDGDGVKTGVEHRYSPGWRDLELRAGYRFDHYDSQGCEYRYDLHEWSTGLTTSVGFDIELDTWVSFAYQPYEHISAYYPDPATGHLPKHRDRTWRTGLSLERPIGRGFSVIARYDYTNVDSNTNVYEYDRHIVGGYVRYRFQ